jgi:hypothetical protein
VISRSHLCRLWAWHRRVLVLSIYRHDNAPVLNRIVHGANKSRWDFRLWALDQVHPLLAPYSVGAGGGPKFPLLNQLIRERDLSQFDWVVVTDDDVIFDNGSLAAFLWAAEKAGLALAQPAHALGSFSNHEITLWKPHTMARLTTFVEIGPMFAIKREYYEKFLPFPEDSGMGWGLDVEWSDRQASGARLGIIDWVTLRHLSPAATNYDITPEEKHLQEVLRVRGHEYVSQFHKTLATWHEWESQPSWLCPAK